MDLISLQAADGAALPALHAPHQGGPRRGGLVLAHEIFGLNANMRALAQRFASDRFEVIAPAFFARIAPDFEAGYDAEGTAKGRAAVAATPWSQVAADVQAAISMLAAPVFVAGFCWGGSVAWLAACRCRGLSAASAFYGRQIIDLLDETPHCPIELHYGEKDPHIPPADHAAIRARHPSAPILLYNAGHGFFSDRGQDYNRIEADRAWGRTLNFFDAHSDHRS